MSALISIRGRLLRDVIVVILLLGASIFGVALWGYRETVESMSGALIRRAMDETELRLDRFMRPISRHLRIAEMWWADGLLDRNDPESIDRLLIPLMRSYPQLSAVMLADDRGREHMLRHSGTSWQVRLTRRDLWGDNVRWEEWSDSDPTRKRRSEELEYDPRERPWFRGATGSAAANSEGERDAPTTIHWTEPYTFFTGKDPGITASISFRGDDEIEYVLGFDVRLNQLTEYTSGEALRVSENGRVFVIDEQTSEVLGLPADPRFASEAARTDAIRTLVTELGIPVVDAAMAAHAASVAGERPFRFESGRESWWGGVRRYRLAEGRSLLIGVVVPESDLLGRHGAVQLWIPIATLLAVTIAIWRAFVMAGLFSRPIEALVEESERIRMGDLEQAVEIRSGLAEIRKLADAQNRMRVGLRSLLKLEGDLQVARQIQQNTFPQKLPKLRGFEIDGWSDPADETGGDTYDVIGLVSDARSASIVLTEGSADRAVLLLADATGHGVGPALSVTQLRAMLRVLVRTGHDLESIARHANEQLCADLPGAHFITAWFGLLDAASGSLTSWSAGQGPLLRYVAAEDRFEVCAANAPPMGVLASIPIEIPDPVPMQSGDLYAVFSDGIYEAADPDDARFGEEAVQEVIRAHRSESASEILSALRHAVTSFARGRSADDDRTGIVIKRL